MKASIYDARNVEFVLIKDERPVYAMDYGPIDYFSIEVLPMGFIAFGKQFKNATYGCGKVFLDGCDDHAYAAWDADAGHRLEIDLGDDFVAETICSYLNSERANLA